MEGKDHIIFGEWKSWKIFGLSEQNSELTLFPDSEPLKDSPFSDGADLHWKLTEKEARDPEIDELFYGKAPGT